MKLEEVLPALRDGKKICKKGEGLWSYYYINGRRILERDVATKMSFGVNLTSDDILANDWEAME